MKTYETAAPEDMAKESTMLDVEGFYHFIVADIVYGRMLRDEMKSIDGLNVSLEVLHGPQKGKSINLILNDPNLSHKDKGNMARTKQTAFFVATNLIDVSKLGQPCEIDENSARGAQLVAELRHGTDRDGNKSKYLDWHFSNIYHVDDPRAAKVAKCAESLSLIPPEFRHTNAAYFAPVMPKKASQLTAAKPANEAAKNFDQAGF